MIARSNTEYVDRSSRLLALESSGIDDSDSFEEDENDENTARYIMKCRDLVEDMSRSQNPAELRIMLGNISMMLREMEKKMKEEKKEKGGEEISEHTLGVLASSEFTEMIYYAMTILTEEDTCKTCELLHQLSECGFKGVVTIVRGEQCLGFLRECLVHESEKVRQAALRVVVDGCGRRCDFAFFAPILFSQARVGMYGCVSQFIRLQLHFIEMSDDVSAFLRAMWESGNVDVQRNIAYGIMWCAQNKIEGVIHVFVQPQWVMSFAILTQNSLSVTVSIGFRLIGRLVPYIDNTVNLLEICSSFRAVGHWIDTGSSERRENAVFSEIAYFLKQIIKRDASAIDMLLEAQNDTPNYVEQLFAKLSDANYYVREFLLDLILTIYEEGSSIQKRQLPVAATVSTFISMIHSCSERNTCRIVRCLLTMPDFLSPEAFDTARSVFHHENGHDILANIATECDTDVTEISLLLKQFIM